MFFEGHTHMLFMFTYSRALFGILVICCYGYQQDLQFVLLVLNIVSTVMATARA